MKIGKPCNAPRLPKNAELAKVAHLFAYCRDGDNESNKILKNQKIRKIEKNENFHKNAELAEVTHSIVITA